MSLRPRGEDSPEDLALVEGVQAGDEDATRRFLAKFRHLAVHACRGMFAPGLEFEDIVQHAMIGVWRAALTFDASKGKSLKSWLWKAANVLAATAVKTATRRKHEPLNGSWSFEYPNEEVGDRDWDENPSLADFIPPGLRALREAGLGEAWRIIDATLTDLEFEVIGLWLAGHSFKDMAQAVDKTPKQVDNAVERIKRKLRAIPEFRDALRKD